MIYDLILLALLFVVVTFSITLDIFKDIRELVKN